MNQYDVAVIGLGPAGAVLAGLLSARLRVIAIDLKSGAADSVQKPCGGLLSGEAQKVLAAFDLTLPKDLLVDPQIFAVKTIDLPSRLVRHYQRGYLNLDRHRFDRWLRSMIPERVEVHENARCTALRREGDGFSVTYREDGEERSISAKWLVGADGANSLVRRTFFPSHGIRRYLAIQQWFADGNHNPFYSCIFDPETTDCCSWSISKDRKFLFGGAFPLDHPRQRFERQKEKLAEFGFAFGTPLKTEACLLLRPAAPWEFCCGGAGVFLIGEAAGFVSPSSLEGISSALLSARALGEVLNRGGHSPERDYARATRSLRGKLSRKLLKCPAMYQPSLRRLVMRSGVQSLELDAGTGLTQPVWGPERG